MPHKIQTDPLPRDGLVLALRDAANSLSKVLLAQEISALLIDSTNCHILVNGKTLVGGLFWNCNCALMPGGVI